MLGARTSDNSGGGGRLPGGPRSAVPIPPGADQMVRTLLKDGFMSADWLDAFTAVPRQDFLPAVYWAHDGATGQSTYVHRDHDPGAWQDYADSPHTAIVTQWDDGDHEGTEPGDVPTSASSEPRLVAAYLRDACIGLPMRALIVGTGTGWDTGLMGYRLGGENVFSIEVDAAVADAARTRLLAKGLDPTVITGDGSLGWSPGAPYDRVIMTAGVRAISPALLEQTREGGLILCPWGTHYSSADALVRLTKLRGGSASGRFLRPVEFIRLRGQRIDWGQFFDRLLEDRPADAITTTTPLTLADLGGRWSVERFVCGLAVRDCACFASDSDGADCAWFLSLSDESWASCEFRHGEPTRVYQSGPRRLVDDVEAALGWWERQGRPPLDAFGLLVTPDGLQRPWLGDASNPVPVLN